MYVADLVECKEFFRREETQGVDIKVKTAGSCSRHEQLKEKFPDIALRNKSLGLDRVCKESGCKCRQLASSLEHGFLSRNGAGPDLVRGWGTLCSSCQQICVGNDVQRWIQTFQDHGEVAHAFNASGNHGGAAAYYIALFLSEHIRSPFKHPLRYASMLSSAFSGEHSAHLVSMRSPDLMHLLSEGVSAIGQKTFGVQ